MQLKSGVKLYYINEPGCLSFIKDLGNKEVLVSDEFGMEYRVPKSDLMLADGTRLGQVNIELTEPSSQSEFPTHVSVQGASVILDLHMEHMLSATEARRVTHPLDFQIKELQKVLRVCRKKKVSRIIAIHGKGAGILRQEILNLLHSQEDIQVCDASFDHFGGGALEIKIFGLHR